MRKYVYLLFISLCVFQQLPAAIALKDGRIIDARYVAKKTAQEHYQLGLEAIECKDWAEGAIQFQTVLLNYPETRFAQDSFYYLGLCYFYLGDYDLADQNLSHYLQLQAYPKHFRDVMYYKFAIAERFAAGARRHIFGWEKMPAWVPAREYALTLFDEVAASMPGDEIAAKALYGKGQLLCEMQCYKESVESYQMVIKRFPKNPLAPDSYVAIARVYALDSIKQAHNPDLLGLAQVNLRRFRQDFPGDERIAEAEEELQKMQEWCAAGLIETAHFYERTKHPKAAVLYYKTTIQEFPHTCAAQIAKNRLLVLCPEWLEDGE